jgi:hypothetical protein
MRILLVAAFLLCGCHSPVEDRAHHVVHHGETAVLHNPSSPTVLLAYSKADCYPIEKAAAEKDEAALRGFLTEGKAFAVATGASVQVVAEGSDERQVRVNEGPQAGKTGWVVWEFLRSPERASR